MNPQVLIVIMSASVISFVISILYFVHKPKKSSESTRFLAQPKEIIPNFILKLL